MPTGETMPSIPQYVADHMILQVPREFSPVFSSKKLADEHYAVKRLQELTT